MGRVIEQFDGPEDVTFVNVRNSHAEIVGKLADRSGNSRSLLRFGFCPAASRPPAA